MALAMRLAASLSICGVMCPYVSSVVRACECPSRKMEDRERGLERVPKLVQIPAVVHFLSCEPLLGPLDEVELSGIDWVIVGGESGPGARRLDPTWAQALRARCAAAGIAFFFKQAGTILAREWGMNGKGHNWELIPAACGCGSTLMVIVAHPFPHRR